MLYAEDGNALSWDPKTAEQIRQEGSFYGFLATIPLSAKKGLLRAVNGALGNYMVSDIFGTSAQVRWVAGVLRLGLQLPIEDIDLAYVAFKQYSNIAFVLHGQRLRHDVREPEGEGASVYSDPVTLEALIRPSVLFNPRVFFEHQLPVETVSEQPGKEPGRIRASNVITHVFQATMPDGDLACSPPPPAAAEVPASTPASPFCGALEHDSPTSQRFVSSRTAIDRPLARAPPPAGVGRTGDAGGAPAMGPPLGPPLSASQMAKALDLWDQYVELLEHVLQVYSTMIRGLQPLITRETMSSIIRGILGVIDMLLSQRGTNPHLVAWRNRYRPVVGPKLWDKTWETLGDRLERQAIKLLLDVWSRMTWQYTESMSEPLHSVRYWMHRDNLVDAWVVVVGQLFKRALRIGYPHDKSIGVDRVRVHFSGYSVTATATGEESVHALLRLSSVPVDYSLISAHGYVVLAREICGAIERALAIKKVVVVDGVQYAQQPPSANYILHLYGDKLFAMALCDNESSSELIDVKRRAIAVLACLLTLREYPTDPILPRYLSRILHAISEAMTGAHGVQSVLPSVALLLKNTRYIRIFIPGLHDLVFRVLPKGCGTATGAADHMLRRDAYEALGALMGFVGYYHQLGRSDMIPNSNTWLDEHLRSNMELIEGIPSSQARAVLVELVANIETCAFEGSARNDVIFMRYLRCTFQTLLLSVACESSAENLQYATCIVLLFLYQYAQYNPRYIEMFVELYVHHLRLAPSEKSKIAYIYGLLQAAMLVGANARAHGQRAVMLTAVVNALADCDRDLRLHTQWHPSHQVFISSLRCLSYWVSTLDMRETLPSKSLDKLKELLARCSKFIARSRPEVDGSYYSSDRRLRLATSDTEAVHSNSCYRQVHRSSAGTARPHPPAGNTGAITSFTLLGLFKASGRGPTASPADERTADKRAPVVLSSSLYETLYTTISVFSAITTQTIGGVWGYVHGTSMDTLAIRQALRHEPLQATASILRNFKPSIVRSLEGYVPMRVRFFTTSHFAIYSVTDFQNLGSDHRDDRVIYTAARFVSGRQEWLAFVDKPGHQIAADDTAMAPASPPQSTEADGSDTSSLQVLPWIRKGECLQVTETAGNAAQQCSASVCMDFVPPMIDEEGEQAIDAYIENTYRQLHTGKYLSDIRFKPALPPTNLQRGNTFDRPMSMEFFGADFGCIDAAEPFLEELDLLDNMDMPFLALAGVIYLQSPESLSTKRNICKGPLQGISEVFSQFVESLNRSSQPEAEQLRRTHGSAPLLQRVFLVNDFKVCYHFAPNVSSLVSGEPLDPQDNAYFYELLRERGITVIWFDSHPGSLDADLAWQFIDRLQSDSDEPSLEESSRPDQGAPGAKMEPPTRSANTASDRDGLAPLDTSEELYCKATSESPKARSQCDWDEGAGDQRRRRLCGDGSLLRCTSYPCRVFTAARRRCALQEDQLSEFGPHQLPAGAIAGKSSTNAPLGLIDGLKDLASDDDTDFDGSNYADADDASVGDRGTSDRSTDDRNSIDGSASDADTHDGNGHDKQAAAQPQMPLNTPVDLPPKNPKPPGRKLSQKHDRWDTHERERPSRGNGSKLQNEEGDTSTPEHAVRVLIALAPIENTQGRLLKVAISATGGPEELNGDFERMTGPLMSNAIVQTKDIAHMLSSTILDAAANRASLQGDDFSMIYKREEMLADMIGKYAIRHQSIDDAHKFMFPVGKSGMQCTLDVHDGASQGIGGADAAGNT